MEHTVLWAQNATPLQPATYVINGEITQSRQTSEQQRYFQEITDASQNLRILPKEHEKVRRKFPRITDNCNYNITREYVYLQSNFEETDEIGRRMPFMFLTRETSDFAKAVEILKAYAARIGRTVSDEDIKFLEYEIAKKKRSRLFFSAISIIVITLIVVICLIASSTEMS